MCPPIPIFTKLYFRFWPFLFRSSYHTSLFLAVVVWTQISIKMSTVESIFFFLKKKNIFRTVKNGNFNAILLIDKWLISLFNCHLFPIVNRNTVVRWCWLFYVSRHKDKGFIKCLGLIWAYIFEIFVICSVDIQKTCKCNERLIGEFCANLDCILLNLFFGLLAPSVAIALNCSLISQNCFIISVVYFKTWLTCTERMICG